MTQPRMEPRSPRPLVNSVPIRPMNFMTNHKSSKFIIHSDSKLYRMKIKNASTSLITRVLVKMHTLSKSNSIIFIWKPNHIGIHWNETVDKAAKKKKALLADTSNTKIPYTDLKSIINKFILKWQKSWNNEIQNKLHCIQDNIGEWPTGYRRNRKKVILTRLRINHTHITHSNFQIKEDTLICSTSKVYLSQTHSHELWQVETNSPKIRRQAT